MSKEIYYKKKTSIITDKEKECLSTQELETIFEAVLNDYIDTSTYLKKFERIACKTKIPQFKNSCEFLFGCKEGNYYELLEQLESHYLYLCDQGLKL